ncbi:hypothetical protein [Sphingobium xenophagum]|uniref:DUF2059 domain-containing protein n=1 Tax=Sphingobium xenophagum TaxID=121428 RepID=A0A401J8T0_SPHXE|nr:hypothetical protein [Sphingobium xenophagum]GBH32968.1 hypothetical protein MBESOW_P4194 [Sphingobium xenophagum]
MFTILLAALLQSVAPGAPPSGEAETLGRRLAASSALASMIPMLVEKDLAELAAEAPDLSDSEKQALLTIGRAQAAQAVDKLLATMGHAYAERLSIPDMRALIAANDRPETKRFRAAQPAVKMEAMRTMGEVDLKKSTAAAFCKQTKKLCDRK